LKKRRIVDLFDDHPYQKRPKLAAIIYDITIICLGKYRYIVKNAGKRQGVVEYMFSLATA
jgi:hypothetical protein